MAVSEELREKVTAWMKARVKAGYAPVCAACGLATWNIGGLVPADVPMVQIICENCGHVFLISAEAIGWPST